jgi:hypothetical protein
MIPMPVRRRCSTISSTKVLSVDIPFLSMRSNTPTTLGDFLLDLRAYKLPLFAIFHKPIFHIFNCEILKHMYEAVHHSMLKEHLFAIFHESIKYVFDFYITNSMRLFHQSHFLVVVFS